MSHCVIISLYLLGLVSDLNKSFNHFFPHLVKPLINSLDFFLLDSGVQL